MAAWDAVFGDGSDGSATLDGTATVGWASKSGSTYTMTRDALLVNLTLTSGSILKTAGYVLFGTGTFTINSGCEFERKGPDGSGTGLIEGSICNGSGAGGLGSGAGGSVTGAIGGAGGAGGAGDSGSGGTAGGVTNPAADLGTWRSFFGFLASLYGTSIANIKRKGGAGGGGGGDSGAGGGPVRGGVGGGVMGLLFATIVNNGSISAKGGDGANGIGDNGGGGGGGGGGVIYMLYRSFTGNTPSVAGGAGGAKTGTGVAGAAGSAGSLFSWEVGTINTGPQGPAGATGATGADGTSFDVELVADLTLPAHPRIKDPVVDVYLRKLRGALQRLIDTLGIAANAE